MVRPPIPENEEQRLIALEKYRILDTLPEEDYDNITQLASLICETPISTITFLDAKRDYLKSSLGLPAGPPGERDLSFCAHAINNPGELMIVPDTRLDQRFADHPFVIGEPHVIFYSGIPLVTEDGFALGALCVVDHKPHQITQAQQNALRSLGKQVTRLLDLRLKNEMLTSKQNKLEQIANDMEMFAYIASHDLKEPLRMVKSFVGLLKTKYSSQLDEKANKFINLAVDGSERMEILIDDLLAYFTAGTLSIKTELTDINEVIEEVKELLNFSIKEKHAVINTDHMPVVNMPRTAAFQIFQNIISNALKYQRKGSKPEIKISAIEQNEYWEFSIKDNGIGISQENLEKVFKIFKRLHNKQEYSGTGIGLAIVKRIVEQHEGKIWVESEHGCTFRFTIKK